MTPLGPAIMLSRGGMTGNVSGSEFFLLMGSRCTFAFELDFAGDPKSKDEVLPLRPF